MAEYIYDVVNQTSKLDWAFPFQRTGAFPIDRSILFSSLADATAYAQGNGTDERGLGGTSYVGQIISVYEAADDNGNPASANAYIITPSRGLLKLAATTASGDVSADIANLQGQVTELLGDIEAFETALENVYTKTEADGKFALAGDYATKEEAQGYADAKDGDIAAAKKAGDDAQDAVDVLAEKVGTVDEGKTIVQMIADAQEAATYDDTELADKIATIEGDYLKAADKTALETAITDGDAKVLADAKTYSDGINTALQEQITTNANAIERLTNGVSVEEIDGVNDLIEYVNEHGTEVIGMKTDISKNATDIVQLQADVAANAASILDIQEDYLTSEDKKALQDEIDAIDTLVGGVSVSERIAGAIADKVDKVEGSRLMTDAEGTKLEGIADGANVNVIDTVDTAQFGLENKHLTLLDIAMGKVTGLSDALAGKVDKAEGARLLTEDEATKLEKLVLGENGEVSVSGKVSAGNVDGLDAWITARAGTLEGLSENNLSDTLLAKIEGIAEGAQANVIDTVSDEFTVTGKHLVVNAIAQDKITGLVDALAGKVDAEAGYSLISEVEHEKLAKIADGAQVNVLEGVKLGDTLLDVVDKAVTIPVGAGLKASDEITIGTDGALGVGSINVNKLTQTDGEVLILNGGASV